VQWNLAITVNVRVDELGFEPLTIELLRAEKQFVKLAKRQQKDGETLAKRHRKERSTLQRQHCGVFDKVSRSINHQAKFVGRRYTTRPWARLTKYLTIYRKIVVSLS